jgi:LPS O-antigen subunit length determinant protein (WzzB/FepE family)
MKPLIRWAASLYPAPWRERYGAEFTALLDDVHPGWRDFLNILHGAFLMQLKFSTGGKIVAAVALAGLAVAGWFAVRTPDRYVSTAVVQYAADSPEAAMESLRNLQQEVFSRSSLTRLIMQDDLYRDERRTEPLEDIVMNMRRNSIAVRALGKPAAAFSVSFEYPDRYKAQKVAHDLTGMFVDQNVRRAIATRSPATMLVLDPASLPSGPIAPRRSRILIMGFAGGLLLGLLFLGVRRWRMSTRSPRT